MFGGWKGAIERHNGAEIEDSIHRELGWYRISMDRVLVCENIVHLDSRCASCMTERRRKKKVIHLLWSLMDGENYQKARWLGDW